MIVNRSRAAHYERCRLRAREAFVELRSRSEARQRQVQITGLPSKQWNGVRVYPLTCAASYGKGPHVQYVPAYVLWSLIDLRAFVCPYHR